MNVAYNEDCFAAMREMRDKAFDLAVVDPPYGVKYARGEHGWGVCDNRPSLKDVEWDEIPPKEYFDELRRVSRNQIIWGGNYFTEHLPPSKCWIVWDKICNTPNESVFADCELAWTSFTKVCKLFKLRQMGFISDTRDDDRIHPTQKPTELYRWIYQSYAKEGDKILDTHLGSGSSRIAAYDMGFDFVGYEISKYYFEKEEERFARHTAQLSFLRSEDIELSQM